MKEEFIKKLNNKEYISKYLYLKVQKEIPSLIPNNFNLDTYNNEVLASDQIKYKDYFQNMYNNIDPNIHLDEDQIKAILTDEEYSLIIAGAGTGKNNHNGFQNKIFSRHQENTTKRNPSHKFYQESH